MEEQPKLPDLNTPPRPQLDHGGPVTDANGNLLVLGFKSVDAGHETTQPLGHSSAQTAPQQPVRALILTGFGINCEEEFAAAYKLAGAEPTIVHLNQVLHGHVSIHDYDILNFPGGFSFGDDLGSGVVLANKLRYRKNAEGRTLLDDIKKFIANGKFVMGICNGFQVLVKLGLLPNLSGNVTPEVTLTHNASGRYEDRWVRLKVNPESNSPFLKGIDTLEVPVRHGEGRLIIKGEETLAEIEAQALNCLAYTDFDGSPTDVYPHNPNGADLNCAGLTDTTGQVFGLMPHPEAFLSLYNHPDWARRKRLNPSISEEGDGLRLFRNIVEHIRGPHPPAPSPVGRGSQTAPAETSIAGSVFTTTPQKWEALKEYARDMRKQPTPAEERLWEELRGQKLDVKFRRQHAIDAYIVDFVTIPDKLIVEVDGDVHAEVGQAEYDAGRTHALQELGYQLLRFTNDEVLTQTEKVLATIQRHLDQTNQTERLRSNS
ncbi:phosphoribosylformylglycinamidine synthase subunit PurQ [Hymenobacter sublimis]|uniref:Phosphoribosylformylglycinamidine synthase subunit PurQ n=1 Tax=Hymenobacter sublimis TaxID=2933777 RepID=A0ABY4J7B3_9BACT|nr:phosphoribosylformylglycinamidine synthase subunit PurQ [Hymenobacter sublimis]UPL48710.1 phosphoribosylformylglycinamidine synthase subunit PurQ [Hymenobacter sublimis]